MRIGWPWALLLTTCLMLVTPGTAWAHVVVSPEEVPADSYQVLTVRAPTEKDVPTTQIRVEVPEGFTVVGVRPVPGWDYEFEEEAGLIRAITWSGGEIEPREFQEFPLQARAPQETGGYAWRAFQTYEDGSVVEWVRPPEDAEESEEDATEETEKGPASVVEVVGGGIQGNKAGTAVPQSGGGFTSIAAYGGLVLGAVALAVALLALVIGRRAS